MKKLIAILLALMCALPLTGCLKIGNSEENSNTGADVKTEEIDVSELGPIDRLIREGKYAEAWYELYMLAENGDEDARERLLDFHIVPAKDHTSYYRSSISSMNDYHHKFEYTYDDHGNVTSQSSGSGDISNMLDKNEFSLKQKYTMNNVYDANGRLIRQEYVFTANGNVTKEYDYTYSSDGRLLKIVFKQPRETDVVTEYTYDEAGNLIKTVETSAEEVVTVEYDGRGNIKKEETVTSDGGKITQTYTYDERGNKIRFEYAGGDALWFNEYTYDDNGKLIKKVCTPTDGHIVISEYTYIYDEAGRLIKRTRTEEAEGEKTERVYEYIYDENGVIQKYLITDTDGYQLTCEYSISGNTVIRYISSRRKRSHLSYVDYDRCSSIEELLVFYRPNDPTNEENYLFTMAMQGSVAE